MWPRTDVHLKCGCPQTPGALSRKLERTTFITLAVAFLLVLDSPGIPFLCISPAGITSAFGSATGQMPEPQVNENRNGDEKISDESAGNSAALSVGSPVPESPQSLVSSEDGTNPPSASTHNNQNDYGSDDRASSGKNKSGDSPFSGAPIAGEQAAPRRLGADQQKGSRGALVRRVGTTDIQHIRLPGAFEFQIADQFPPPGFVYLLRFVYCQPPRVTRRNGRRFYILRMAERVMSMPIAIQANKMAVPLDDQVIGRVFVRRENMDLVQLLERAFLDGPANCSPYLSVMIGIAPVGSRFAMVNDGFHLRCLMKPACSLGRHNSRELPVFKVENIDGRPYNIRLLNPIRPGAISRANLNQMLTGGPHSMGPLAAPQPPFRFLPPPPPPGLTPYPHTLLHGNAAGPPGPPPLPSHTLLQGSHTGQPGGNRPQFSSTVHSQFVPYNQQTAAAHFTGPSIHHNTPGTGVHLPDGWYHQGGGNASHMVFQPPTVPQASELPSVVQPVQSPLVTDSSYPYYIVEFPSEENESSMPAGYDDEYGAVAIEDTTDFDQSASFTGWGPSGPWGGLTGDREQHQMSPFVYPGGGAGDQHHQSYPYCPPPVPGDGTIGVGAGNGQIQPADTFFYTPDNQHYYYNSNYYY